MKLWLPAGAQNSKRVLQRIIMNVEKTNLQNLKQVFYWTHMAFTSSQKKIMGNGAIVSHELPIHIAIWMKRMVLWAFIFMTRFQTVKNKFILLIFCEIPA